MRSIDESQNEPILCVVEMEWNERTEEMQKAKHSKTNVAVYADSDFTYNACAVAFRTMPVWWDIRRNAPRRIFQSFSPSPKELCPAPDGLVFSIKSCSSPIPSCPLCGWCSFLYLTTSICLAFSVSRMLAAFLSCVRTRPMFAINLDFEFRAQ